MDGADAGAVQALDELTQYGLRGRRDKRGQLPHPKSGAELEDAPRLVTALTVETKPPQPSEVWGTEFCLPTAELGG